MLAVNPTPPAAPAGRPPRPRRRGPQRTAGWWRWSWTSTGCPQCPATSDQSCCRWDRGGWGGGQGERLRNRVFPFPRRTGAGCRPAKCRSASGSWPARRPGWRPSSKGGKEGRRSKMGMCPCCEMTDSLHPWDPGTCKCPPPLQNKGREGEVFKNDTITQQSWPYPGRHSLRKEGTSELWTFKVYPPPHTHRHWQCCWRRSDPRYQCCGSSWGKGIRRTVSYTIHPPTLPSPDAHRTIA